MNILAKLEIENCTGCHSCYNCCPVAAISMKFNEEGFLIPSIDEKKCLQCGKCIKTCPVISFSSANFDNRYYAAYCKDQKQHIASASGGLFGSAAEYIVEHGGYAVGAAFDSQLYLRHIIISDIKDLKKVIGTKYVQSEIGDVFRSVKKLLNDRNTVLFSGTSCQIAGLKTFLQKEYENLICMDLICHGVPSPIIWKKYLNELSPNDKIERMTFRDKSISDRGWPLIFECMSGGKIVENYHDNKFIKGFIKNYYLRLSCHNCRFKGVNRCSDITLGDFWGVECFDKSLQNQYGTSITIIHTKKGQELFKSIADKFIYKEVTEETAINIAKVYNSCLFDSVPYTRKRKEFFEKYETQGILSTVDELSRLTWCERIKSVLLKIRVRLSQYIRHRR